MSTRACRLHRGVQRHGDVPAPSPRARRAIRHRDGRPDLDRPTNPGDDRAAIDVPGPVRCTLRGGSPTRRPAPLRRGPGDVDPVGFAAAFGGPRNLPLGAQPEDLGGDSQSRRRGVASPLAAARGLERGFRDAQSTLRCSKSHGSRPDSAPPITATASTCRDRSAILATLNSIYIPLLEEPRLAARLGAVYRCYCEHRPRVLPRRWPWDGFER